MFSHAVKLNLSTKSRLTIAWHLIRHLSRTYYEVLGVKNDCTQKEIRDAYVKLCKQLHPDVKGPETSIKDHSKFMSSTKPTQPLASLLIVSTTMTISCIQNCTTSNVQCGGKHTHGMKSRSCTERVLTTTMTRATIHRDTRTLLNSTTKEKTASECQALCCHGVLCVACFWCLPPLCGIQVWELERNEKEDARGQQKELGSLLPISRRLQNIRHGRPAGAATQHKT
uniref:Putative dnaj molecular chaperone similarity domain protein n=1 Tax=Rhipicephalus microplus TaxID=6941 RepID=A0A6G5A0C5_RHIMP